MVLQKVYIVCYVDWDETDLIGVYTSYEQALKVFNNKKRLEKELKEDWENEYRENFKYLHTSHHHILVEVELNKECNYNL